MNTKRFMLLLAVMVFGSMVTVNAQEDKKGGDIKPLLGTWQYVEEVINADGSAIYIGHKIYKTILENKAYFRPYFFNFLRVFPYIFTVDINFA